MTSTSDIQNSASTIVAAISDIFAKTAANNVLVEGNEQLILGTPDLDLTQIKLSADDAHVAIDLPRDQAKLRSVIDAARAGNSTPELELALSTASAIGFCNMWRAYWPTLLASLQESNVDRFTSGMQNLQNYIARDPVGGADAQIQAIGIYRSNVATAVKALTTDQDAFRKYFNANGAPLDIEKEVNEIQAKMAGDNATTARGASKQGLGVLIITVVVVATIFSKSNEGEGEKPDDNEAANKLIGYSVDMIKDDIKEQTEAAKDWKANFLKYGALVEKLNYDKQVFVAVSHFVSAMNDLEGNLSESVAGATDVQQQWKAFGGLLANIASEVTKSKGADKSALIATLTAINDSLAVFDKQLVSFQKDSPTVRVVTG